MMRVVKRTIIAVRQAGLLIGQTDGVVAYESAHLEGVASERVVRSGHSTQAQRVKDGLRADWPSTTRKFR